MRECVSKSFAGGRALNFTVELRLAIQNCSLAIDSSLLIRSFVHF